MGLEPITTRSRVTWSSNWISQAPQNIFLNMNARKNLSRKVWLVWHVCARESFWVFSTPLGFHIVSPRELWRQGSLVSWGLVFLSFKRSYMLLCLTFWDHLSPNTITHLELGFLWFLHLNILFPWIAWLAFSFLPLPVEGYCQNMPAKCIFYLICIFVFS